jgi:hypothetical protein
MWRRKESQEGPSTRPSVLSALWLLSRLLGGAIVALGLILGLMIATVGGYWFFTTPYACVDETAYLQSLGERANSGAELPQLVGELEGRSYLMWDVTPSKVPDAAYSWVFGDAQLLEPRDSSNQYIWYRATRIGTSAFVSTYDLLIATTNSGKLIAFGYRSHSSGWS